VLPVPTKRLLKRLTLVFPSYPRLLCGRTVLDLRYAELGDVIVSACSDPPVDNSSVMPAAMPHQTQSPFLTATSPCCGGAASVALSPVEPRLYLPNRECGDAAPGGVALVAPCLASHASSSAMSSHQLPQFHLKSIRHCCRLAMSYQTRGPFLLPISSPLLLLHKGCRRRLKSF
jgi:hypothetical protein